MYLWTTKQQYTSNTNIYIMPKQIERTWLFVCVSTFFLFIFQGNFNAIVFWNWLNKSSLVDVKWIITIIFHRQFQNPFNWNIFSLHWQFAFRSERCDNDVILMTTTTTTTTSTNEACKPVAYSTSNEANMKNQITTAK